MRAHPWIRSLTIIVVLLLSRVLSAAEAEVDRITVKDGTVLKGKIKRVDDDKLILATDFSDDIAIDVGQITDVESTQPFSIRLITGEILAGFIEVSDGRIILRETLPAHEAAEPSSLVPSEIPLAAAASGATSATAEPEVEPGIEIQPEDEADVEAEPEVEGEAEFAGESEVAAIEVPAIAQAEPPLEDLEPSEGPGESAPPTATVPMETADTAAAEREFDFEDVDWIRKTPPYLRYEANLNAGAQLARGNSDTTDLHFDARFDPSFGWNTIRIFGQYDKKKADGDTTTNRWDANLAYERNFHRRWFVGLNNSYEADHERDLNLRIVAGAGVGYRFFDADPTFLSVLPSIAYVNENYELADDDTNYAAFRLQLDFTRDLYNDDIRVYHYSVYLDNLQDLSDINLDTRTGLEIDMPWDLVLAGEFQANWENEPAAGTKKLDTRYLLKIGFKFSGDENDWFH